MDARLMNLEAVKEGIRRECYEITGVLETGEVILALVTESEKNLKERFLVNKFKSESVKISSVRRFMNKKGRPAKEIMQIYKQYCDTKTKRCKKNNLRIR